MYQFAMKSMKSWVLGALLAASLFTTGQANAEESSDSVPAVFDDSQAIQGLWETSTNAHGVEVLTMLGLKEDGTYQMKEMEARGTEVRTVANGHYTYKEGVLTLYKSGKVFQEVRVEFEDDCWNFQTPAGRKVHWVKDHRL